jgi:transposase InsO family protein
MPWRECTSMSERREMVMLAVGKEVSVTALSERFRISRKTVYKWLGRYRELGWEGLEDRSRRPLLSPARTPEAVERQVCSLRRQHPAWGGRKLHHRLLALGVEDVPAPSTITGILARQGLLSADRRLRRDWQRFEEAEPNALWQMDFKGHFSTAAGRCHALTVMDDHSRYNVCLKACTDERAATVTRALTAAFLRYGLPERMLMDNGAPWGSQVDHPHTRLTAWLIRLGISISHGRPYHPQTQGKEERFHRTLSLEVLSQQPSWTDIETVQLAFDAWREVYNLQRPHEAVGNQPPVTRYRPSARLFPAVLPPIAYLPGDEVRKVQDKGRISFRGRDLLVSRAFVGERVALRQVADGRWDVFYCHQRVARLDLAHTRVGRPDPLDEDL